jgi:phage/plasmid primase-like uncharacterized protein
MLPNQRSTCGSQETPVGVERICKRGRWASQECTLACQCTLEVPPWALDWRDASLRLDRNSRKNQIQSDPVLGPSGCSADF